MKEQLEAVRKEITELTKTIKEHLQDGDKATLDMEALEKRLAELQAKMAELQSKWEKQPVRPGVPITEDGEGEIGPRASLKEIRQMEAKGGRFDGIKLIDIWAAQHFAKRMAGNLGAIYGDEFVRRSKGFLTLASEAENELNRALKAMASGTAGAGAEFVGTGYVEQIWEDFYQATRIGSLFAPYWPMRHPTEEFPLPLGSVTFRKGTANVATTATDLTTDNVGLDASNELVGEVDASYNLDEDAFIDFVAHLRETLTRNAAENLDNILLNADNTNADGNINSDGAAPAGDERYLIGWDGLRHYPFVDYTTVEINQAGAPTYDMYINLLKAMGKYGLDMGNVVFIMDNATYFESLKIDELITVDKFGPQATILTGQLAAIAGVPIVASGELPKTQANGKVSTTSTDNTKGTVLSVHRRMWKVGFMRQMLLEVDRDIQKRQHIFVISFRPGFNCWDGDDRASTIMAGARNITV